jgi:ThiF family
MMPWRLILPRIVADELAAHLFPGDGDEHGAVLLAGVALDDCGYRLVGRELIVARDGADYIDGIYGYRRLRPEFVRAAIIRARDQGLAYLAVHCHGGTDEVGFSDDDRASQARGYPALLDISRGQPVGALVAANNALAGALWLPDGRVLELTETRIVGSRLRRIYSVAATAPASVAGIYERQTRIFGPEGQDLLAHARVGIIGAGGGGMLLVEYLARLGVGELVVVDPDRVAPTNLPRLPGTTARDAYGVLGRRVGHLLRLRGRAKIEVARRLARAANPNVHFVGLRADVTEAAVAARLRSVDYLFCAADSMGARLVFNALIHQYGIPGVQIGAKVVSDGVGGLADVRSVVRFVTPDAGCLWCNGLISAKGLAEESLGRAERAAQRYVDDEAITAPSVITLNAMSASIAANDFLLRFTGAKVAAQAGYLTVDARLGRFVVETPRRDDHCPECGGGPASRASRADSVPLPVRVARQRPGLSLMAARLLRG